MTLSLTPIDSGHPSEPRSGTPAAAAAARASRRSARGGATISVGWSCDAHAIRLDARQWKIVREGGALVVDAPGSSNAGPVARRAGHAIWSFESGQVLVTSGRDGDSGWYGPLRGARVVEHKS